METRQIILQIDFKRNFGDVFEFSKEDCLIGELCEYKCFDDKA